MPNAYNQRGEVIRGEKQDPAGNLLDGHRFTYQYDFIGNRRTATLGAPDLTAAYTAKEMLGVRVKMHKRSGYFGFSNHRIFSCACPAPPSLVPR